MMQIDIYQRVVVPGGKWSIGYAITLRPENKRITKATFEKMKPYLEKCPHHFSYIGKMDRYAQRFFTSYDLKDQFRDRVPIPPL